MTGLPSSSYLRYFSTASIKNRLRDLDPLGPQSFFLVQMLLDGPADHLPLHRQRVHVAVRLTDAQKMLAAGNAQLHELVSLFDTDFSDAAVVIDGPLRGQFQNIAVLDG